MARLENTSINELRAELDEFDDRRPMLRLLAAILYKQGPSGPTIARWLGVRPATVYGWFDRIENRQSIAGAIRDDPRTGRPSRLAEAERQRFRQLVQQAPTAAGYDAAHWTPALAQRLLREAFDAEYSRRHVRRLLEETDPR